MKCSRASVRFQTIRFSRKFEDLLATVHPGTQTAGCPLQGVLGNGSSAMKDVAGKLTALAQGLGGVFASDELVRRRANSERAGEW